jgi:hypothetical protein
MTRIRLQNKDDSERYRVTTGVDVNHALTTVAQEVAQLLKQTYSVQADRIDRDGTIDLPAIESKQANHY